MPTEFDISCLESAERFIQKLDIAFAEPFIPTPLQSQHPAWTITYNGGITHFGRLGLCAEAFHDTPDAERYAAIASRLIAYLDAAGNGNPLKELQPRQAIEKYFPSVLQKAATEIVPVRPVP